MENTLRLKNALFPKNKNLRDDFLQPTSDNNDNITVPSIRMCLSSLYLGLISFGGPIVHIGLYNKYFIQEHKLLSDESFSHLFAICNVIPGPTSTQMLTSIVILKTQSIIAGIMGFLCFMMPGLIAMIIAASMISRFGNLSEEDSNIYSTIYLIYYLRTGICQGATALVFQAAVSLTRKVVDSTFQIGLIAISAILYFFFDSYYTIISLIMISGYLSMQKKESEFLMMKKETEIKLANVWFIGIPPLVIFFVLYGLVSLLNYLFGDLYVNFYLMECMYRIGSLIIGGGHVVIPMLLTEFQNKLQEKDILNAFTFVSLMPGPMFNVSGYIGTLLNGFESGFLSAIFIFLPGLLMLFAALKSFSFINKHPNVQFFLRGVSSCGIGLIFTSAVRLWYDSCIRNSHYHPIFGTLIVIFSYILLERYQKGILVIFMFSAIISGLISLIYLKMY